MQILLDSHALLWFLEGNEKMPEATVEIINTPENEIYVSIVSIWEIAIKFSIGKLQLDGGVDTLIKNIEENGFSILDVSTEHVNTVAELHFIHRDPFDRMLVAQAMVEGISIMTIDSNITKYDINSVW